MATDDGLPESVKRAVIDRAKEKAEYSRTSGIDKAANDVRFFVETDPQQDFYGEWSQLIVALGKVLKAEKWDRHLETIQSDLTGKFQNDAFKYAVQIYQAAVSGDKDTVLARLEYLSQAVTSGDENEKEVMGNFCALVNEALRRDIMIKLREKEFPSLQVFTTQKRIDRQIPNAQRSEQEAEILDTYVSLDQAAAMVGRTMGALRAYSDLPDPDIEGGGRGQRHEWLWSKIRPWLESKFGRKLPERFPDVRNR